ncbi:MAG: hypothetical protein ACRDIW_07605, partial [Actinomycetota bacterium]
PTRGEIAGALERLTGRIEDLRSEVNAATEEAEDPVPLYVAIGAGLVGLIALALAVRQRAV